MKILENTAEMFGCTCEMKKMGAAEALCSDKPLADRVARICGELGLSTVEPKVNGGSEDYAYMMNRVSSRGGQAVFFRSLVKTAGVGHSRTYDFDEQVMANAVQVFCAMTLDILG